MSSKPIRTILLTFALLLPLSGQPKGKLTVAGKTATINHAYAYLQESSESRNRDELVVVLSDFAVPADIQRNQTRQDDLAKSGKIHFVRLTFEYPAKQGRQVAFHYHMGHNAAKEMPSGTVTYHLFEGKLGPDIVAGKVSSAGPQESLDGVKYEYSCEFSVKLLPKTSPK